MVAVALNKWGFVGTLHHQTNTAMTHIAIDIQDEQETDRVLALLARERIPYRVEQEMHPFVTEVIKPKPMTAEERAEAHARIMRGAPTLDLEAMLEHLRESRQDRPLPFRDEA